MRHAFANSFALVALTMTAGIGCVVTDPHDLGAPEIASGSFDATSSCGSKLAIGAVSASDDDGNVASNVLDGNLATRWSGFGVGTYIVADLGNPRSICGVSIAWYRGDHRTNNFAISVSSDDTSFTTAFTGTSSGTTLNAESYMFAAPIDGRYVKITVNGNSENDWASITELAAFGGDVATPAAPTDGLPAPLRTFNVTSLADLQSRISSALPGDQIVVANGTYTTTGAITIKKAGTTDHPIVITAQTVGGVTIQGAAGFQLSAASYVIVRGFVLRHRDSGSGIDLDSCQHVQISRNDLQLDDGGAKSYWVYIHGSGTSGYNRIDHNVFHDKPTEGPFIVVYGPSGAMSQHDRIDSNYFARQTFTGSNGGEGMRLGVSEKQLFSAYLVVEHNLFEQCDGDPEVISNKSSDNLIRWNTLRNNTGSIVLRHGNRATVDGNFILGGRSGIRVNGNDHRIINNYIAGTTGSGVYTPITVRSGTVKDVGVDGVSSTDAGYDRADRVVVAFNTLVGNANGIMIGSPEIYPPSNCTISNNIVQSSSGTLLNLVAAEGLTAQANIAWGLGTIKGFSSSAYRRVDPLLVQASDGVYRISAGSPAIDTAASSASFPFVTTDVDGQSRTGALDVGADEFSTQPIARRPLNLADVGPSAP